MILETPIMRDVALILFPSTKAARMAARFSVLSFLMLALCLSAQALSIVINQSGKRFFQIGIEKSYLLRKLI